jgi:hypothetical protein
MSTPLSFVDITTESFVSSKFKLLFSDTIVSFR